MTEREFFDSNIILYAQIDDSSLTMYAFRLSERYQFSFWDSLIIVAALEAHCSILYTEDLQNGQIIDGVLKVKNPFVKQSKGDGA